MLFTQCLRAIVQRQLFFPRDRSCFLSQQIFQTGDLHDGTFSIGVVDGLAGMAQGGLGIPATLAISAHA
jgi:hypothetical protein